MKKYTDIANKLYNERYRNADFVILAGSIVRGEGTKTSDLDIVVVYDKLERAYRESYIFEDVMVEVFVHDLSTIKYFMYEVDYKSSIPTMATMITEGIVIPCDTNLSRELKRLAIECINRGPEKVSPSRIDNLRYSITNLVDDLKDSRNRHEQIATGCRLYEEVSQLYFSINRFWQGKAKSIVRVMQKYDSEFANRYNESFDELFRQGEVSKVVKISEEVLNLSGGSLFDGYKLEASPEWRNNE